MFIVVLTLTIFINQCHGAERSPQKSLQDQKELERKVHIAKVNRFIAEAIGFQNQVKYYEKMNDANATKFEYQIKGYLDGIKNDADFKKQVQIYNETCNKLHKQLYNQISKLYRMMQKAKPQPTSKAPRNGQQKAKFSILHELGNFIWFLIELIFIITFVG